MKERPKAPPSKPKPYSRDEFGRSHYNTNEDFTENSECNYLIYLIILLSVWLVVALGFLFY